MNTAVITTSRAIELLATRGAVADRYLTHMWLGTPPIWRPEMIFGLFNFGVG